jgi:hypothetical protein
MKVCTICHLPKEDNDFDKKKNGSVSGYCKDCRKDKMKSHYNSNKQYYYDKSKRLKAECRDKYRNYKRTLSCTDCGISFREEHYLCEFHHIHGDKMDDPANFQGSWSAFIKEISKCVPLCCNCHRRRHNAPVVQLEEYSATN